MTAVGLLPGALMRVDAVPRIALLNSPANLRTFKVLGRGKILGRGRLSARFKRSGDLPQGGQDQDCRQSPHHAGMLPHSTATALTPGEAATPLKGSRRTSQIQPCGWPRRSVGPLYASCFFHLHQSLRQSPNPANFLEGPILWTKGNRTAWFGVVDVSGACITICTPSPDQLSCFFIKVVWKLMPVAVCKPGLVGKL